MVNEFFKFFVNKVIIIRDGLRKFIIFNIEILLFVDIYFSGDLLMSFWYIIEDEVRVIFGKVFNKVCEFDLILILILKKILSVVVLFIINIINVLFD